MSGLIVIFAAFLALIVLDVISITNGVDSRPDFDDLRGPHRGFN